MNPTAAFVALAGFAVAASAEPQVRLRYATFDPLTGSPHIPQAAAAPITSRIFIIQFHTTPTPADRFALESRGIAILRYVPDHAYVARAPVGLQPRTIPGVRWAGPYHAAYRLDESLLARTLLPRVGEATGPVRCGIELFEEGLAAQAALDAALRDVASHLEYFSPDERRVEALLTPAQALAAARLDEVAFIDPAGPAGADMDIARELGGAAYLENSLGMLGQGVRGEVSDTDLNVAHAAFQNPPPLIHGLAAPTSGNHGTPVYGIVFANDPSDQLHRGLLPQREQGIASSYTRLTVFGGPVPLKTHLQELVDPAGPYRGVFFNSCVGSPMVAQYSTITANHDDALFHVDVVATQSLGNLGSITNGRPQAWAKNVLTVMGISHYNTLTRADDTSFANLPNGSGPALDGRVKPDLAHIGDFIHVLCPGGNCAGVFSGDSAATPLVSGSVGLACQLWHEQAFSGFGGGPSVFDDRPRASTIRALLINSAYQYDWTQGGPNASLKRMVQGWGMPDMRALYDRRERMMIVNETDVLAPQESRSYQIVVLPGEDALKATMIYLDPPGNPAVQAQHRVNDLSLKLTAPDGVTVYWGNNGLASGIWSQPGGAPDTKNVVENVFVQNPQPGHWLVQVSAPEVVMDAHLETPQVDADFALVISGAEECPFACYPDCNADCNLTIADFGCFQAAFVNASPYADCNGSGTLTIADFACYQAAFAAGCP